MKQFSIFRTYFEALIYIYYYTSTFRLELVLCHPEAKPFCLFNYFSTVVNGAVTVYGPVSVPQALFLESFWKIISPVLVELPPCTNQYSREDVIETLQSPELRFCGSLLSLALDPQPTRLPVPSLWLEGRHCTQLHFPCLNCNQWEVIKNYRAHLICHLSTETSRIVSHKFYLLYYFR